MLVLEDLYLEQSPEIMIVSEIEDKFKEVYGLRYKASDVKNIRVYPVQGMDKISITVNGKEFWSFEPFIAVASIAKIAKMAKQKLFDRNLFGHILSYLGVQKNVYTFPLWKDEWFPIGRGVAVFTDISLRHWGSSPRNVKLTVVNLNKEINDNSSRLTGEDGYSYYQRMSRILHSSWELDKQIYRRKWLSLSSDRIILYESGYIYCTYKNEEFTIDAEKSPRENFDRALDYNLTTPLLS